MYAALEVPDLAANTPLWMGLLAVFVNAVVGALRGYTDTSRNWDIVGVSIFALLTGLGGGFIRDVLIGNLPAESLRDPWYVASVFVGVLVVVLVHKIVTRIMVIVEFIDSLALGLFAVIGVATEERQLQLADAGNESLFLLPAHAEFRILLFQTLEFVLDLALTLA